jgi:sortase (surface protein transpeptidase)
MPKLINGLIVSAIVIGVVLAFVGSHTLRWSPPPAPPKWEAPSRDQTGTNGPTGSAASSRDQRGPTGAAASSRDQRAGRPAQTPGNRLQATPMARSVPVAIYIPHIGVQAKIISLGLTPRGTVGVPPLTRPFITSWYDRGPTPGAPGAAVIFGHVDSAAVGPAVFYRLGDLRPGDLVYITLKDRRTAMFRIYSAALYQKAEFPDQAIYGYTSWPSLRLVTCGGQFDRATGHYLSNTVVFAQYVGQRTASARR